MADTVDVQYIYPPQFENLSDDPTQGFVRFIIKCTNLSDGTGESAVQKLDLSDFRLPGGSVPQRTTITKIQYATDGMQVKIEWDRTPKSLIALIPEDDSGVMDYPGGLVDPGLDDATGDILFTTVGHTAADTYDITIHGKFKQ
ncbi:MAG: hypothetical protein GY861_02815 [bacterium]|nr:hypothetical protein [bacterium]